MEMEDLAVREIDAEVGTEVVGVTGRLVCSAAYKRRILGDVGRTPPEGAFDLDPDPSREEGFDFGQRVARDDDTGVRCGNLSEFSI